MAIVFNRRVIEINYFTDTVENFTSDADTIRSVEHSLSQIYKSINPSKHRPFVLGGVPRDEGTRYSFHS